MDLSPRVALARLRTEALDLVELVLLPGLAAMLPWHWCFRLFQRMARWHWLYRSDCELALAQARQRGWGGQDEANWLWTRRLVTLVDHADHYLGLWRSDAWIRKHLRVEGTWPAPQRGLLLLTFHWGAGYWGLRHAAAQGLRPHALVATLGSQAYQGRTILSWYAHARNANVARTLGAPTIDIAQQLKQVIRALRDNQCLLGVMDVPADHAKASLPVTVLGMQASVPRGLLRLAVDQQVPIVLYVTGLNTANGSRFLTLQQMDAGTSVEDLAQRVFAELDKTIALNAPAWHFWAIAERFFQSTEPVRSDQP